MSKITILFQNGYGLVLDEKLSRKVLDLVSNSIVKSVLNDIKTKPSKKGVKCVK